MKLLRMMLVLLLLTAMLVCFAQGSIFAALDQTLSNVTNADNYDDTIYYSDLFYGYAYYLQNSAYLNTYHSEMQNLYKTIYDDFINSPTFWLSDVKEALASVVDVKKYIKAVTDATGLTNFTYNDALDAANRDFAQGLLGECELSDIYGKEAKFLKRVNNFVSLYNEFDKEYDIYEKVLDITYEEEVWYYREKSTAVIVSDMVYYMQEKQVFHSLTTTQISVWKEKILPDLSVIGKILKYGSEGLTIAKTLAFALMIEDLRMELLDDILSAQSQGTMLYDGMSRLKNQLRNGFVSYFYENYIEKKLLASVGDLIVDPLIEGTILSNGTFAIASAMLKIASWVVFDVILDVPGIDDLTKQMVLRGYCSDLYGIIHEQSNVFSSPFSQTEISKYESLFTAYVAANKAAISACDKLQLSTNRELYKTVSDKYKNVNIFTDTINYAKRQISDLPMNQRVITNFGTWRVSGNIISVSPSDTVEAGYMYLGNSFKGNIIVGLGSSLTIPKGEEVRVDGNVLSEGSKITVNGSLEMTGGLSVKGCGSYADGYLDINGQLTVNGTVETWYAYAGVLAGRYIGGHITMSNPEAKFYVGGDFLCAYSDWCQITDGTVVFNGTEQQNIKNLRAKNISITNPAGIIYKSSIHVFGAYLANGNPIVCNGFYAYLYTGCSFDPVSDYGNTAIYSEKAVTLTASFKGNVYMVSHSSLMTPGGVEVKIDGNVTSNGSNITVNGSLKITGDLTVDDCNLNIYNEDAKLYVGGDITFSDRNLCCITKGAVILNGTAKQTIKRLKAPTIILENESEDGVVFATSISPSTLFNHNGNRFTLKAGGSFADYDGDGLTDNTDPAPTVGNPSTIIFRSGNTDFGTVSRDSIDTIGGARVWVRATPTDKYQFVKWVDSAGKTVSTLPDYTFVAKKNETFTAVFEKRTRSISTEAVGGSIAVPGKAEIESWVRVSLIEKEGYVYREGSLKYNGNPVENGQFFMPDENVVLTAEFVRNDAYFSLENKIDEARAVSFGDYSAKSYSALQDAIRNAQQVLENHISAELSALHVENLNAALFSLESKYGVSIAVIRVPKLYYSQEQLLKDIVVQLTYDNGTVDIITDYEIEHLDIRLLGEQTVTVKYDTLSTECTVIVERASIDRFVLIYEIEPQKYVGNRIPLMPEPVVILLSTGKRLVRDIDYILKYSDNDMPGTGYLILSGIGNYAGSSTLSFAIYCEHQYAVTEQLASTCMERGHYTEVCGICGDAVITELPLADHISGNWVVDREPTFEASGARHRECTVCHLILQNEEIDCLISGDLNRNGKIDSNDYIIIRRMLLGMEKAPTPDSLTGADVNGNGKIDSNDCLLVRMAFLGIEVTGNINHTEDVCIHDNGGVSAVRVATVPVAILPSEKNITKKRDPISFTE